MKAATFMRASGGVSACSVDPAVSEAVSREARHGLELRMPVRVLTEAELRTSLSLSRLPRHMKSIPTLSVPRQPATVEESIAVDNGSQLTEQVLCCATQCALYKHSVTHNTSTTAQHQHRSSTPAPQPIVHHSFASSQSSCCLHCFHLFPFTGNR